MDRHLLVDLRGGLRCWQAGPREDAILAEVPGWRVTRITTEAERRMLLASGADALWCWHLDPTEARRCPGLRWVSTPAAGADYLPCAELRELGIVVTVSHGHHGPAMAEHALGMILALARRLDLAPQRAREGAWWRDELDGRMIDLFGAQAAIVGYGAIGREVARRILSFGCEPTGLAREPREPDELGVPVVGPDDHDEILRSARIVIDILPHTPATRRWFDAERLALLPADAIFVNLGRGETVDEGALLAAVRDGRLRAGLDVMAQEPLPADDPLRTSGILLTPHASALTDAYLARAARAQSEQMVRFATGEELRWQVDPKEMVSETREL